MLDYIDFDVGPWRLLDALTQPQLGFTRLFGDPVRGRSGRYPRVNVWENEESLVFDAEIPGVDTRYVDIAVDGNELALTGGRGAPEDVKTPRFERRFELPFAVDVEKVEAVSRNGVIRITLPKAAEAKRRRIDVKSA